MELNRKLDILWKVSFCRHKASRYECQEPECVAADVMEEPTVWKLQEHYKTELLVTKCRIR